jgi:hypothetical protein
MKTYKLHILIASLLIIAASCTKDENLSNEQAPQANEVQLTDAEVKVLYQMRNENNKVSIEEATQFANDVIGFLDGETAVKSGTARRIASVGALRLDKTTSIALKSGSGNDVEMPDTVAYVFNFADSAGFALIAGDTRIDAPILAYSGSGTLGSEVDNPGVAVFLEGIEEYVEQSIIETERIRDSLMNDIEEKLSDVEVNTLGTKASTYRFAVEYGTWQTVDHVYPLLPVEWRQGAPFNQAIGKACSDDGTNGGRAPAGCVAIATAQLIAYWQHPYKIDGRVLNYALLRTFTCRRNSYDNTSLKNDVQRIPTTERSRLFNSEVAYLVERIGKHVCMDYECGGSEATTSDAVEYLRELGYKYGVSGYFNEHWELGQDYSYSTVINSLNKGQPVLTSGKSYKTTYLGFINTYSGGHAWVVDGYLTQKQMATIYLERVATGSVISRVGLVSGYVNEVNYLHNNWGWGGIDNGYYVAGSFDSNASEVNSNTKAGNKNNYQYKIQIFPYISR